MIDPLIADIIAAAHKRSEEINALDEAWRDTPAPPKFHDIQFESYTEIDMTLTTSASTDRFGFYCWSCDFSASGYRSEEEVQAAIEAHSRT